MYYSITFGTGNSARNTWTDWQLKPESPPVIPTPKPKTNYVEIPGRTQGPLDMTKIPFGVQTYERITGKWVFVMNDDYWHTPNRIQIFEDMRGSIHGLVTQIVLEEDPTHKYYGRFTVDPPQSGQGPFAVQIGFDLEPVRYNLDGTADLDWLPDVSEWAEHDEGITIDITAITDPEIHALFDDE